MADGTWEVTDMEWWKIALIIICVIGIGLLVYAGVVVGARSDKDGDDHET